MEKSIRMPGIILILGTMLIFHLPAIGQIDGNYNENRKKAFAAGSAAEYQSSLKFCTEVLKVIPNQPRMNYLAARLNEQLGNSGIALKYLKKAAKLGYTSKVRWFDIHQMNDPVFSALREKKEFKEIIEIMKISDKPIHKSQIAFTVKDKKLGTEGITYDPVEKIFYLGSDYKIVKVDQLGNSINFTKEGRQDGLGWVNGIHVDSVRRTLWACSNEENRVRVEIFKYNLSSGKLIKKYTLPSDGNQHMFNDLVIHSNGDVYITDTLDGAIYMISSSPDKLELFLRYKLFTGLNGITLSGDGRVIFVADDGFGIYKIDIKTKSIARLTHGQDFNTYGIDGLYFANNYLYAVHNLLLCQVSRFSLNKDATHIESCEIFEKNTPNLRNPTTGVIVDDYFYFIANSRSNQKGVLVMKTPLK
jgi:hypothetical protein